MSKPTKTISTEEFDRIFDEGEDITPYLDMSTLRHPNLKQKRVNVDFPLWMVRALDESAAHIGVPRQALIKMWLADRLEEQNRSH